MRREPLVFDIARGSAVDGPGLRTTVFFKGCPLRCSWCHNPESQRLSREIGFYVNRCIDCGTCSEVCPNGAIDRTAPGRIRRSDCAVRGACAEACDSLALRLIGRRYSEDELLRLILRDRTFFDVSGGGVTFSGGEPLIHLGFLGPLARRLHEEGVHVAVETCGHFDYPRFQRELLPWVDCILYDLKIVDPALHRSQTGRGNHRILTNFEKLVREKHVVLEERERQGRGTLLIPRIPLIPDITTTRENLEGLARLLRSLGVRSYVLLSYNPSGLGKWKQLGRAPHLRVADKPIPLAREMEIRDQFRRLMSPPPIAAPSAVPEQDSPPASAVCF